VLQRYGAPIVWASLLSTVMMGSGVLIAQDTPRVFRSSSHLVVLHVNVFDGRSDAIAGLPQTAFTVFEDGVRQTISFFNGEDVPVSVGLLIDNSSSMLTRRRMTVAGTNAFAESSHPQDEVFTMLFNESVKHGLPDSVPFTRSRSLIQASLSRYPAGGQTALHDAVVAGLEHLEEASHQKRVLVVLTDGDDNASRLSERDMLQRADRSSTIIYTISTANFDTGVGNQRVLQRLADTTGGLAYRPRSEADVIDAFIEIAANIRRGYSLGYEPTNSAEDGRYRRIKVTVTGPDRKRLSVRARDGYLAPRRAESD
jgi:Ca-activated chloride channel homolog